MSRATAYYSASTISAIASYRPTSATTDYTAVNDPAHTARPGYCGDGGEECVLCSLLDFGDPHSDRGSIVGMDTE